MSRFYTFGVVRADCAGLSFEGVGAYPPGVCADLAMGERGDPVACGVVEALWVAL